MRHDLLAASLLTLLACSQPTNDAVPDAGHNRPVSDSSEEPDSGSASDDGGTDGDLSPEDNGSENSPSSEECVERARWIYLVDADESLVRYEPDSNRFTRIGALNCGSSAWPFSMAVARDATAYVLYSDGNVFRVSTEDASCEPTGYRPTDADFTNFGMGFVSDAVGSSDESLFVCGATDTDLSGSSSLATLDLSTWKLAKLGSVHAGGELTGNGNGELWGFFPFASPMMVRQLDKASGATLREFNVSAIDRSLFPIPDAWAFAFWGGRYYMFLKDALNASTGVYRLTPETNQIETVVEDSGYRIVGAGVSTCAPVVVL